MKKKKLPALMMAALMITTAPAVPAFAEDADIIIAENDGKCDTADASGAEKTSADTDSSTVSENAFVESVETADTAESEESAELSVSMSGAVDFSTEDGSTADNESLWNGYVAGLLEDGIENGDEASTVGTVAGDLLTGSLEKTMYEMLKSLAEQVAAGTLTSTEFLYSDSSNVQAASGQYKGSLSQLGASGTFTASDLGVDAVIDLVYTGENTVSPSVTNDANQALLDGTGLESAVSSAVRALQEDCPFTLYWYNKTVGIRISYTVRASYIAGSDWENVSNWYLYFDSITISMAVSSDYAPTTSNTGYTIDTTRLTTVMLAKAAAQSIVDAYAEDSDYDKLRGYMEEIKTLASYNYDAYQITDAYYYGDPWQVIYVFDGDTSTTVTCEGYAKAFQYLCDLSTFTDSSIYCISASSDAHMWNIVHTSTGNYLVDVTFCDEGMEGAPDQLFMVGTSLGNVSSGYTFTMSDGIPVVYKYSDETLAMFPSSYLALSTTDYDNGSTDDSTDDGTGDNTDDNTGDGTEDGTDDNTDGNTGDSTDDNTGDSSGDDTDNADIVKDGLVLGTDGIWYYYVNGNVDIAFTGIVDYNGGRFFVTNGIVDSDANGLNLYDGVWYYLSSGKIHTEFTGVTDYNGGWFYIKDGVLDTSKNGLVEYNGSLFVVSNGQLQLNQNGLWQNSTSFGGDGLWYFIAAGKVQEVSQVVMYDGEFFVVVNGVLASEFNGTIEYDGVEFKVESGQLYEMAG